MIGDTGDDQRFVPTQETDAYFAFLSLYAGVENLVVGKRVLDAGCGAGYGSCYLARRGARTVVALDASLEGVRYGGTHYDQPNLHFVLGDCIRLPLPSRSFDVVFSSNVIEHVADYEAFLLELKRVMEKLGVLVLVTPPIYEGVPVVNPFHVTNLTAKQWEPVLRRHFDHVQFLKHYTPNARITFSRPLSEAQSAILTSEYFAGLSPEIQSFLRRKIFNPLNVDLGDWEITRPATLRELEEPATCSVMAICSDGDKPGLSFSGTDRDRLAEWRVEKLKTRLAETEAVLYQFLTNEAIAIARKKMSVSGSGKRPTKARRAWTYLGNRDLPGLMEEVRNYFRWRLRR